MKILESLFNPEAACQLRVGAPLAENMARALSRRTNRPAHRRLGATPAPRWRRGGIRRSGCAARLPQLNGLSVAARRSSGRKTRAQTDVLGLGGRKSRGWDLRSRSELSDSCQEGSGIR